jgi:putative toxin-antitoxin system antitoxin component (TIGR02293 family)
MIAHAEKRAQPKRSRTPRAESAASSSGAKVFLVDFPKVYLTTPDLRVKWIRSGVPASEVKDLVRAMDIPQDRLFKSLNLSTATINRKASRNEALSTGDSERVVGMAILIGQVQAMVEQSGNAKGFDAAKWVAQWLEQPLPALDGEAPGAWLDTMEGQRLVSNLLSMMQSGAYA